MSSKKYTKKDLERFERKGFSFVPATSEYEVARMKGPCTVVLYKTGKLLVQGKEEVVNRIKEELGEKIQKEKKISSDKLIGSDEALKGDTFGGLVVAGFRADKEERKKLKSFDVQDSKNLSDRQIIILSKKLKESFPENYHVENINAEDYNGSMDALGLTNTLNELHKICYKKLKLDGYVHVVDKYPGCKAGDIIEPKAESKYLEVAAASIMARASALEQLDELSEEIGFKVPKGSTHVKTALEKLKKSGLNPKNFVKLHFSNVKELF